MTAAVTVRVTGHFNGLYIGYYRDDNDNWLWADNSDPDFEKWAAGEPGHVANNVSYPAWSTNTALDNAGTGLIIMCPMIIMYSMCGCFCTTSTNKIHYYFNNPLSPHDALKHHLTSLKAYQILSQLRVLEGKF